MHVTPPPPPNDVRPFNARVWLTTLVVTCVVAATLVPVAAVTADENAASLCSAHHKFGAEPVDVAKTADGQTVLAQVSWGHHPSIGCYLVLDDAAISALRAASPPRSLPQGQTDASIRCSAHHKFGAEPVDVAKTADGQTVLARLSWGYHQSIGCYLVLDTPAIATLRTSNTQPEPVILIAETPQIQEADLARIFAKYTHYWDTRLYGNTRARLASLADIPANIFTLLASDTDEYVRQWVAANPSTPADTLAQLANDTARNVRQWVAGNPSTPADTLAQLANDTARNVRWAVATNPNTQVELLAQLASDNDQHVREMVAENPNTPAETLTQLADTGLAKAVAGNPSTPADTLTLLANDTDFESVAEAVAGNPSTPADTLTLLANDYTCRGQFRGASCTSWDGRVVRRAVAGNPSTPAETLTQLANDPASNVRELVAGKPQHTSRDPHPARQRSCIERAPGFR